MTELGVLRSEEDGFVLTYAPLDLAIRGSHPEWVLTAAAEIISGTGQLGTESRLAAAEARAPDGDGAVIARFDVRDRFRRTPTCLVTLGGTSFRWVAPSGAAAAPPSPHG
jgi:hypothetical protein